LENIFLFIFSEKIFQNFFEKKNNKPFKDFTKEIFFKKFFLKKIKFKKISKSKKKFIFIKKFKNKKKLNKLTKYNFTKF
jgi:hypothetical protein